MQSAYFILMQPLSFATVSSAHLSASPQPFRKLAQVQHTQLFEAAALTRTIPHEGKHLTISDFAVSIQDVVQRATERIIFVSKQSVVMLYTLQNMERELAGLTQQLASVQTSSDAVVRRAEDISQEAGKRRPDRKRLAAWARDLEACAEQLTAARAAADSAVTSLMEKSPQVQRALESMARVDITTNLTESEHLQAMLQAFDTQQLKLYTALMNAVLTNKRMQDL